MLYFQGNTMSLVKFSENIWSLEGDSLKLMTIPFGTRMTIIRLTNNDLWLHSPVSINPKRIDLINELGRVSHLIAPNNLHHLFIDGWSQHFPHAKIWVVADLPQKCPNLNFTGVLKEKPESYWENEIEQLYFQGSNILPEMVFFHKSSKTLIVTDLIQNHDPLKNNWFWRTVKRLNGILAPNGGVPKDLRLTIQDKILAKKSLEKVLSWDFETIIISHGICINENAKEFFKNSFNWLQ